MHKSHRGFTLLEILLVLLVMSICAAAFVPVALNTVDSARARSGLRQTVALNRFARSQAIVQQKKIKISYHPDGKIIRVSARSHSKDALQKQSGTPSVLKVYGRAPLKQDAGEWKALREIQLPKNLEIEDTTDLQNEEDASFIIFNENGSTDSHTITLKDADGSTYQVRVEGISGNIDVY